MQKTKKEAVERSATRTKLAVLCVRGPVELCAPGSWSPADASHEFSRARLFSPRPSDRAQPASDQLPSNLLPSFHALYHDFAGCRPFSRKTFATLLRYRHSVRIRLLPCSVVTLSTAPRDLVTAFSIHECDRNLDLNLLLSQLLLKAVARGQHQHKYAGQDIC